MSWGEPWSPEKVLARLVRAFGDLPEHPVYSPSPTTLAPADGQRVTSLELLAATAVVLGAASPERVALLLWARATARPASVSLVEWCRQNGIGRTTLYRRRDAAAAKVADALSANHLTAEQVGGDAA